MSYPCDRCTKSFKTRQKLERHHKRKTPCVKVVTNTKCDKCDYVGKDRFQLYRHKQAHIRAIAAAVESGEIIVPPTKQDKVSLIPACDYGHWERIDFPDWSITRERKVDYYNYLDSNNMFVVGCRTYQDVQISIRVDAIRNGLTMQQIQRSLEMLRYRTDNMFPTNVRPIMNDLFFDVHSSNQTPQFHTIFNSDISRGTLKMYNRIKDSDYCHWTTHHKQDGVRIINDNVCNLMLFLLHLALPMLQDKLWLAEKQVVLLFDNGRDDWLTLIYHDRELQVIRKRREQFDVVDCDEHHLGQLNDLKQRINLRISDIKIVLPRISLDDNSIKLFLQQTRNKVKDTYEMNKI